MPMDFTSSLDHKVEEIERPPLLPTGTYRWLVEGQPEIDTIADGRFDVCDFKMKCVGPEEDVDPDDLTAFGDTSNVRRRLRFLFNKEDDAAFKRTEWQLRDFLENHLAISTKSGMTLKELLAEAPNSMCLGVVSHRPDKNDPERFYDEIKKTAPIA